MKRAAAAAAFLAVVAVYLPDVGHGFVKDDFRWIAESRVTSMADLGRLFRTDNGFYRPMVALSFAADHAGHGLSPLGYGLTNLGLLLIAAGLLYAVGRALSLSAGLSAFASLLWLLNPHAVSMAVLWISGRTALLLTVFALAAAWAVLRGWTGLAVLMTLLALLSKEEAVLLPAILAGWVAVWPSAEDAPSRRRRALRVLGALLVALAVYFALRSRTAAYLPATAPDFYRPRFGLGTVARNALEYADRSATGAAAALLVLLAAAGMGPAPDLRQRAGVALGLIWLVAGFGLTVWLPVRSSLYALFPSAGLVLGVAFLAEALWPRITPRRQRALLLAAAAGPWLLLPIYWRRNARWVHLADLSARVLGDLRQAPGLAGRRIVLRDDPGDRVNLEAVFGTLAPDALRLVLGDPGLEVAIESPRVDGGAPAPTAPAEGAAVFVLRDDHLVRMPEVAASEAGR